MGEGGGVGRVSSAWYTNTNWDGYLKAKEKGIKENRREKLFFHECPLCYMVHSLIDPLPI